VPDERYRDSTRSLSGGSSNGRDCSRDGHNRVIVCCEPAALDPRQRPGVMELLREGSALQEGRALVVVTHDARIFGFCRPHARMDDGRIEQVVKNQQLNDSRNDSNTSFRPVSCWLGSPS